jgi:hypothetical protein
MTWPSTPINTTNLDNGADEPRLARADLLATVQAVNSMIPLGGTVSPAYVKYGNIVTSTNSNTFAVTSETPTLLTAGGTGVTLSDKTITVPAGTWLFETPQSNVDNRSSGVVHVDGIQIFNTSNSTVIDNESKTGYESNPAANTVTDGFLPMTGVVTLASASTVQFRIKSSVSSFDATQSWGTQTGIGLYIKITKIA